MGKRETTLGVVIMLSTLASLFGAGKFTLSSASFERGGAIPPTFATKKVKGGDNVSPALSWKNVPEDAKSLALTVVDHNPVAKMWVHWMVVDIPPDVDRLEEGASGRKMPSGCVELENSFGELGYGGPQPPPGTGSHKYVFTLYALNVDKLDLDGRKFVSELEMRKLLKGKVVGQASLFGAFKR